MFCFVDYSIVTSVKKSRGLDFTRGDVTAFKSVAPRRGALRTAAVVLPPLQLGIITYIKITVTGKPGPAPGIGDIGGRLGRHLLEGRCQSPLASREKNKIK